MWKCKRETNTKKNLHYNFDKFPTAAVGIQFKKSYTFE